MPKSPAETERELARALIGARAAPPAVSRIAADELEPDETIAAALCAPNGFSALIATDRRAIIATKRKIAYDWSYDAIDKATAKTGFFKSHIQIAARGKPHKFPAGSDKEAAREMTDALNGLITEFKLRPDDADDSAPAPPDARGAYLGLPMPSRPEAALIEVALRPGETAALMANCRIDDHYGVIAATSARALIAIASLRQLRSIGYDEIISAALVGSKPLSHIIITAQDGRTRIDALDAEAAPQIAEFIQSKARAAPKRKQAAPESTLAAQIKSIDALYNQGVIGIADRDRMKAQAKSNKE